MSTSSFFSSSFAATASSLAALRLLVKKRMPGISDRIYICRFCSDTTVVDCAGCTHGICLSCANARPRNGGHGHGNKPGPEAFEKNALFLRGAVPFDDFHRCGSACIAAVLMAEPEQ
jgi:hypothetical protein